MRRVLPVLMLFALSCAFAQAQVYPFKLRAATKHVDVAADGSSVTTMHNEVELLDGAPVDQLSRQTVPYYEAVQDAVVTEAYTLKPDGRRIPVDLKKIATEQVNAAGEPGQMQKVIAFPNAAVGDTLAYTVLSRTRPTLDGGYMYGEVISPSLGRDDSQLTISVPKSLPLSFDSHGVMIVETGTWGGTTYSLHYAVKNPVSDAGQFVARSDRARRFTFSSYKSFDDLAAAYGKLVLPAIVVTPAVQALADQITAGISDRRAQAEKIHLWIAGHLIYTGVELGLGWYVPREAGAVLASGQGDCKDHAVLFAALLKAKGIDANYVLIDAQNGFTLSTAPTLSAFNHVIVWIPEFKAYVDPTAHAAPFGVLPFAEYGKPVLHIGDTSALHRTPVLAAAGSTLANRTVEKIDDQGILSATSSTTATGPASIALRTLGDRMRLRGPENYLTGGLLVHRLTRTSGTFTVPPAGDLPQTYELSATYTAAPALRLLSGDAMPRPDNVTTVPPAEQGFAGPIADPRFKDADPVACYSGQATDDLSLEFPASSRLVALPQNASIKTANVEYTSRWTLAGQVVKVHREYRAHFDGPLCSGPMLIAARDALARIRDDYRQDLKLQPVSAAAR
jgi:hypothetical protein